MNQINPQDEIPKIKRFRLVPESENVNQLQFMCPACKEVHAITWTKGSNNTWQFNEDYEYPTTTPSIRVSWGDQTGAKCCHSWITKGKIKFGADCTHELSGQQWFELPEIK